jgi:hypothetical protein
MAKPRSFARWTPEDVEILRECWPLMHEQEVLSRLGGNRTVISVRNKAVALKIKKVPERWGQNAMGSMLQRLDEMQTKLREAATVNQLLREKVIRLETQLRNMSLRAFAK